MKDYKKKDYKARQGNRGLKAEKPARNKGKGERPGTAKVRGIRPGNTPLLGERGKQKSLPKGFHPLPAPSQAPPKKSGGTRVWLAALRKTHPLRWVVYAAAAWLLMGLVAGGVQLFHSPLQFVQVEGAALLDEAEVLALSGYAPGQSMWAVDPYQGARRLTRHPWVARADARRIFPGTLQLTVWERSPAFRLRSRKGMPAWMDGEGVILQVGTLPPNLAQNEEALARVQALPRIEGIPDGKLSPGMRASHQTGEARHVLQLLRDLGYPDAERVRVDVSSSYLLRVRMPGNPRLDIPYGKAREALVAYRQLLLADPGQLDTARVVNFSALAQQDGLRAHARIILQK